MRTWAKCSLGVGIIMKRSEKKILSSAVELRADGVIIHFSGNRVRDRSNLEMYQIEATALRYLN